MNTKEISTLKSETELLSLGRMLEHAAAEAAAKTDAIPDDIGLDEEVAAIDKINAVPDGFARRIAALPAFTAQDIAVKARAFQWLDGVFWKHVELAPPAEVSKANISVIADLALELGRRPTEDEVLDRYADILMARTERKARNDRASAGTA